MWRAFAKKDRERMRASDEHGHHDQEHFQDVKVLAESRAEGSEGQVLGHRSRVLAAMGPTND